MGQPRTLGHGGWPKRISMNVQWAEKRQDRGSQSQPNFRLQIRPYKEEEDIFWSQSFLKLEIRFRLTSFW